MDRTRKVPYLPEIHELNPDSASAPTVRECLKGPLSPHLLLEIKFLKVEHTSRDKAINAKIGNVKVRGMETHPMTTSYNLEYSPRKV